MLPMTDMSHLGDLKKPIIKKIIFDCQPGMAIVDGTSCLSCISPSDASL